MAYGEFKDVTSRAASDKMLRDEIFNIANNPKYDAYQRGLVLMVYTFFDKKAPGSGIKNDDNSIKELAKESHKPVIRKFQRRSVHSSFIENIWVADFADMQLVCKFNKEIRFYYVLLIFLVNIHGFFL